MSRLRAGLLGAFVALLVAVGAHFAAGMPVVWAVLVALPVGAVAVVVALVSDVFDVDWTPEPDRPGAGVSLHAASLAGRLAQAAGDRHRFDTRIRPRLRRIALDMVRRKENIDDLDDPLAREVLGADLHDLLTAPDARLPHPTTFAAMMRRLEET